MDYLLIIILIIIAIGFPTIIFLLNKKIKDLMERQNGDQSMVMLQNQITEINKTLDNKLGESTQVLQKQFGQSAQIVKDVTEQLTKLDETNKQVIGFSQQLHNLERVLTSQKQRGNLGEAGLVLVLENILPPTAFKLQYKFEDGDIVDAAIFTKDGIIPVDAKFSLENYNRIINEIDENKKEQLEKEFKNDLKRRIDETSKYIKPSQGTLEFAFMFIPAEAIYYDLLVNEVGAVKVNTRSLIDYAFKDRKVIIVSPTTFAAYLQTVLHGLNALKLEKQTKEIVKNVGRLDRHLKSYQTYHQKLGNSLKTTVNMYNSSDQEFKKIDKDVVNIAGGESKVKPMQIDKPRQEE